MTQADLVKLYFGNGEEHHAWSFCFNEQCPLAKDCALQLSVAYKDPEKTEGYSIYPDAYRNNQCKHFTQMQLVRMAYGMENLLENLKSKDVSAFRISMNGYLGSSTSYYRYKLGQVGLTPKQQQYILRWCEQRGYTNIKFDRYTEEVHPRL